ncbi:uncharacterized protein LOC127804323 [Diospyros lotus]|uniref:uncharacterized protein LOC127804323 n=1 Tax=Diospyros lotus TaxID=55363 RepID=UPI002250F839|nr:uncharacterized protein LOC127804323 [Diospyros lotus]
MENKLSKLKSWKATSPLTAEAINNSLSGLEDLYKCTDELLDLPLTQQALCPHQQGRWFNMSLDISDRLLDVCCITRDLMSQIKEHSRDIQSALRRRKGDLSIESSIVKYRTFRKKMKKEAKKLIAAMKETDNKIGASPVTEQDHHVSPVITALREVTAISISVYHSILLFLSAPVSRPKSRRWSAISKFLHKGRVAPEDQQHNMSELESADFALDILYRCGSSDGDNMQIAQASLEQLEASIGSIENGLECSFRHLIKARASLLNLVSK